MVNTCVTDDVAADGFDTNLLDDLLNRYTQTRSHVQIC